MSSSTPTPQQPLPHAIRRKLDQVRETLRGYLLWRCVYMLTAWVLLAFWLGAAIDYLPVRVGASETPRAVRIAILAAMAGGAIWSLLGWLLPRWLTPMSDGSIAILIERRNPSLKNQLITAVELAGRPADVAQPETHAQLLQRVMTSADQAVRQVDCRSLFNWKPQRTLATLVVLGLITTGGVTLFQWDWMKLWTKRLFALADQPWPRMAVLRVDELVLPLPVFTGQVTAEQTKIHFVDQLARVPLGASPLLRVSADASAKKLPEVCTLYYRAQDGTRGRANLRRIGSPQAGWQEFNLDGPPLSGISHSMSLDVVGLDARLRDLQLEVVDRIVITDLQLDCQYPAYLLDNLSTRPAREKVAYRTGLQIPEGTQCVLLGTCNAALSRVQYTIGYSSDAGQTTQDDRLNIREATVSESRFSLPLGRLKNSQQVEIRLMDQYGLSSEQVLRYQILVVPDTVPSVESRLEGIGLAITPSAYLPIQGTATDDHGIAEVAVELAVDELVADPIPLTLADQQIEGRVDFQELAESQTLTIKPGMTVGLSVRASDRYDLDSQSHVGRGQAQQLAVVTSDQLLVLLDRQELELRQRLEQIISELNQLQEALQSLAEQLTLLETPKQANTLDQFDQLQSLAFNQTSPAQPSGQETDGLSETDRQNAQRIAVLRAQQGVLQTDKSRQELTGIAQRVENLRLQLQHNRIDSLDRQQRLLDKVQSPLEALLADQYVTLDQQMNALQLATQSGEGKIQASSALDSVELVIQALEDIKSSMLDIESYNEIIDLVRTLLEEQERILKETEETQKARVLDLFK